MGLEWGYCTTLYQCQCLSVFVMASHTLAQCLWIGSFAFRDNVCIHLESSWSVVLNCCRGCSAENFHLLTWASWNDMYMHRHLLLLLIFMKLWLAGSHPASCEICELGGTCWMCKHSIFQPNGRAPCVRFRWPGDYRVELGRQKKGSILWFRSRQQCISGSCHAVFWWPHYCELCSWWPGLLNLVSGVIDLILHEKVLFDCMECYFPCNMVSGSILIDCRLLASACCKDWFRSYVMKRRWDMAHFWVMERLSQRALQNTGAVPIR